MSFIDQIENKIRNLGEKIGVDKITDKSHVAVECPKCGNIVSVHRMRARHGFTKCPFCGTIFVAQMERT